MVSSSSTRTKVFISYSHKDGKHLDHLVEHLTYYEQNNLLEFWSDKKITPGAQWHEEIKRAIEATKVAVLLISPSFLASKFIAANELPPLLEAAKNEGAIIFPVIVRPSNFEDTELVNFQAVNSPSMPVAKMKGYERDALWAKVARDIKKAILPQLEAKPLVLSSFLFPSGSIGEEVSRGKQEEEVLDKLTNIDEMSFSNEGDKSVPLATVPADVKLEFTPPLDYLETYPPTENEGKLPSLTLQQVRDAWENVKKRVRPKNPKTASMLNSFTVVGVEGTAEEAIIFIRAPYEMHYKYVQEGERSKDVDWALSTEFKQRCSIRLLRPGESIVPALTLQQVKDAWENVKKRVRPKNPQTAAMLNSFSVVAVENTAEEAIIVIQAAYELHHKYVQQGDRSKYVDWAFSTEFRQKCRVRLLAPGQPYLAEESIF